MENSKNLKKFQVRSKIMIPRSYFSPEEQLQMINEYTTRLCHLFIPALYCENMESWLTKDEQNGISVNYKVDLKELQEGTNMTQEEFQVDMSHLWKTIIFAQKDFVLVTDVKVIS